jgi:hypothetical protein
MAHAFLSYVRENASLVDRLANELSARGVQVWLDRERIVPGQRWRDAIRDGIRSGDLFIACFSEEYLARDHSYMNEELTLAIEELRQRPAHRSWFIPVSLDGAAIPSRRISAAETIHDLQWVDLAAGWSRGVELIACAVAAAGAPGQDGYSETGANEDDDVKGSDALEVSDQFLVEMRAMAAIRERIVETVILTQKAIVKQGAEMERANGMAGIARLIEERTDTLETFVTRFRFDYARLVTAFDGAISNLPRAIAFAGIVGLEQPLKLPNWDVPLSQAIRALQSDRDEFIRLRDGVANTETFTTRLGRAKVGALRAIDSLIKAYSEQAKSFNEVRRVTTFD